VNGRARTIASGLTVLVLASAWGGLLLAQDGRDDQRRFASSTNTIASIISALYTAHEDNFHPIGTTTISFQLQLEGPIDAAFRPESRNQPRGWLNEIAAFRVAQLLDFDNVPPTVATAIDRQRLRRRIDPQWEGDIDELFSWLVFSPRGLRGSASYWVPNLERTSDLDSAAGVLRWSAWLEAGAEIPAESQVLARDLSNMALFDFLIANVDRMSGGNLRTVTNEGVRRVVIRDHNLAFAARPSDANMERVMTELRRTQTFSRHTYERLVALDRTRLDAAMIDEIGGQLIDESQARALLDRREALITYVAALVEIYGQDAIFVFP
jgi:hypothetical protein